MHKFEKCTFNFENSFESYGWLALAAGGRVEAQVAAELRGGGGAIAHASLGLHTHRYD